MRTQGSWGLVAAKEDLQTGLAWGWRGMREMMSQAQQLGSSLSIFAQQQIASQHSALPPDNGRVRFRHKDAPTKPAMVLASPGRGDVHVQHPVQWCSGHCVARDVATLHASPTRSCIARLVLHVPHQPLALRVLALHGPHRLLKLGLAKVPSEFREL